MANTNPRHVAKGNQTAIGPGSSAGTLSLVT
jgi:hypothetical protein